MAAREVHRKHGLHRQTESDQDGMISDREQTESGRNSCGRVGQTKKKKK